MSACQSKPKPPEIAKSEGLAIAQIDSQIISSQDLQDRIQAIEKAYPRVYSTHLQKKSLLEEMIHINLLYEEAIKQGLDKTFEFKSRLADLYVRQLSEKAKADMDENQLRAFFEKHKREIEQISAKHILLKFKPKMSDKEGGELKKKLSDLRSELLKNPSEFATYARKYSEDASANNGGELGYFTYAQMVAPFSEAAFKLKSNSEISPVIQTQYGYHIIQLSGDKRGYENYKALIKEEFARQTQKERLNEVLERLKKGRNIQIFEKNLASLSDLPEVVKTSPEKLIPSEAIHDEEKTK